MIEIQNNERRVLAGFMQNLWKKWVSMDEESLLYIN